MKKESIAFKSVGNEVTQFLKKKLRKATYTAAVWKFNDVNEGFDTEDPSYLFPYFCSQSYKSR